MKYLLDYKVAPEYVTSYPDVTFCILASSLIHNKYKSYENENGFGRMKEECCVEC